MHPLDELVHRREVVSVEHVFEELYRHLSIGLRLECVSFCNEFSLEFAIVLDDPIVDNDPSA